jgi:hypothetical protein
MYALVGDFRGDSKHMNIPRTEKLGLAKLRELFASVGWLFREQYEEDIGIDAHVEIVENDISTGKLIAIQVKSGESYFAEQKANNVIYRLDAKHVEYWLNYAIPVIVVLYNPVDNMLIWAPIHEDTIIKKNSNYKIEMSKNFMLTKDSCLALKNVFKLNYRENRMMKLLLDYQWIKMIREGEVVYAEFENWINKSLTRTSIKIYCDSKNGYKEFCIPRYYTPEYSLFDAIPKFIPWADFEMDIDGYREHMEGQYEIECSRYDKEDDTTYYIESFEDYYEEPKGVVPIEEGLEIDLYRVVLKLNDLGKAFLVIAKYLYEDPKFEFASFSVKDVINTV